MKTYGLIGYPVKHSLSARMHNAAFKKLNLDAHYRLFEVAPEDLEDFLTRDKKIKDKDGNSFSVKDLSGFNITIPHKVRAYEMLTPLQKNVTVRQYPYVFLSGAINTVKRERKDRIEFENTDAKGFEMALEKDLRFDFRDKNIFVFGCGGAGRAVIAGLTANLSGFGKNDNRHVGKIYIYDTNKESLESAQTNFNNFEDIKDKLEFIYSQSQIADKIKNCQLLVNASPAGIKEGDASVIKKELLYKDLSVYDVVYNRETQLIKDAKSRGLKNSGGLGMLLYQGVAAFELWTGKNAPVEVMRGALEEGLK